MDNSKREGTDYQKLIANALKKIKEQKTEIRNLRLESDEKIAIIGMGCRFPGADNVAEFWQLLIEGESHIGEVPKERWDIERFYDKNFDTNGKVYTTSGGFLSDISHFDNDFFGIIPREAECMDPQHRLLLEVTWRALENAGIPASKLKGSVSGVYVGIMNQDNAQFSIEKPESIGMYTATGNGLGIAAGRLSHALGLNGPSLSVDTNCSSSLTSIHIATQGLLNRDCDLALAGGVNLMITPAMTIIMCKAKALSPTGLCSTFDESANGYVRGEGAGMIVLKRLSDAQADKDNILGVICGSAINHGGRSGALPVPNGKAQVNVIEKALKVGNLVAEQVSYVESHGTGTQLGDPIEIEAIAKAYRRLSPENKELIVGTLKPNIGHLESAAGIASVIKVLLMFQNKKIPANVNYKNPNPKLALESTSLHLPTLSSNWMSPDLERYAGVSAFGFCGANAHVVMSDEYNTSAKPSIEASRPWNILSLSAKSEDALKTRITLLRNFVLKNQDSIDLDKLCYSANCGGEHWNWRASIVTNTKDQLLSQLKVAKTKQVNPIVNKNSNKQACSLSIKLLKENNSYLAVLHQWILSNHSARNLLSDATGYFKQTNKKSFMSWPLQIDMSDDIQFRVASQLLPAIWLKNLTLFGISIGSFEASFSELPTLALIAKLLPFRKALDVMLLISLLQTKNLNREEGLRMVEQCLIENLNRSTMKIELDGKDESKNIYSVSFWMSCISRMIDYEGCLRIISIHCPSDSEDIVLSHNQDIDEVIVRLIRCTYLNGENIKWDTYHCGQNLFKYELPSYPFSRKYFPHPKFKGESSVEGSSCLENIIYEQHWEELNFELTENRSIENHLVILADQKGVIIPLIDWYISKNYSIKLIFDVSIPAAYQKYSLDSIASTAGVVELNEQINLAKSKTGSTQVIFCWGLDHIAISEGNSISENLAHILGQLSGLVTNSLDIKLWLITKYSASIPGKQEQYLPMQNAISGMGKSIALEYPEVWGGQIDFDNLNQPECIFRIERLLSAISYETQLVIRNGAVLVPRIRATKNEIQTVSDLRSDKAYVITGGLGAIGISIAHWLKEKGATNIILLGRRTERQALQYDNSDDVKLSLKMLRSDSVSVRYISVDVNDFESLKLVFADIARIGGGVEGIFHTAGVNHIAPLKDFTHSKMEEVMSAKTSGSWNLHNLSIELKPSIFMLFSSIASVWGSGGMAPYSAANSFLDSLAYYRNALALPASVINWGPWADTGMAASAENAELVEKAGLLPISHFVALQALENTMGSHALSSIISDIDLIRFVGIMEFRRPFPMLEKLKSFAKMKDNSLQDQSNIAIRLNDPFLGKDDKMAVIVDFLKDSVSTSLGVELAEVSVDDPLLNLGLDSLTAFEISSEIEKQVSQKLPVTEILKGASILDLASYILEELLVKRPEVSNKTVETKQSDYSEGEV